MFQYKILHRILPTNRKLKQYGIKDSDLCHFCGKDSKSILHLICECDISTMIWQELVDWLNTHGLGLTYLKDNSTMSKTEAQIVYYGSLYLYPSSYQCQPSYKKYIPALTPP